MTDYRNAPMAGISERDYETLHAHLTEQLAAAMGAQGYPGTDASERSGWASDALANEWQPDMTATEWLAAAGKRLEVDTSGCVGA